MATYRTTRDIPTRIPVFPLNGALLFPRGQLPLNIFEPRYLNMLDDAMSGERLIGMIQPAPGDQDRLSPALSSVGCVGRVTSFSETDDGRYLIVLTGVCRFAVAEELDVRLPYRMVRADYSAFEADLSADPVAPADAREDLIAALEGYLKRNSLRADWTELGEAPIEALVHALSAACPFSPLEKQALLETPDLVSRIETLMALLDMDAAGDDEDGWMQ